MEPFGVELRIDYDELTYLRRQIERGENPEYVRELAPEAPFSPFLSALDAVARQRGHQEAYGFTAHGLLGIAVGLKGAMGLFRSNAGLEIFQRTGAREVNFDYDLALASRQLRFGICVYPQVNYRDSGRMPAGALHWDHTRLLPNWHPEVQRLHPGRGIQGPAIRANRPLMVNGQRVDRGTLTIMDVQTMESPITQHIATGFSQSMSDLMLQTMQTNAARLEDNYALGVDPGAPSGDQTVMAAYTLLGLSGDRTAPEPVEIEPEIPDGTRRMMKVSPGGQETQEPELLHSVRRIIKPTKKGG